MTKAKVERYRPKRIGHMVTKERAILPCGCCIFVGITGTREATTGAQACSVEHQMITERASQLLAESLATPSKRLLVDVCATMLTQAQREMSR